MKTPYIKQQRIGGLLILLFLSVFIETHAGQVTYPDDYYSAGDPLIADDMNTLFNELKNAVNDNNSKSSLSELSCSSGQVPKWDGASWICASTHKTGTVSIHPMAFRFRDSTIACETTVNWDALGLTISSGLNCGRGNGAVLYAPVQLPDGARVVGMQCGFYDTSTDASFFNAALYRQPFNGDNITPASYVGGPIENNTGYQVVSSAAGHVIDNSLGAYVMHVNLSNNGIDYSTIGSDFRLVGCSFSFVD